MSDGVVVQPQLYCFKVEIGQNGLWNNVTARNVVFRVYWVTREFEDRGKDFWRKVDRRHQRVSLAT